MKTSILCILCMISSLYHAMAHEILDTIYVNETKIVALFFSEPIKQAITGNDHFVFTYNRDAPQSFGLVQGTPGVTSNVLIITKSGKVYSYILKYATKLPKLNYFIPPSERIGNENLISEALSVYKRKGSIIQQRQYFKRFAAYLLKSKPK